MIKPTIGRVVWYHPNRAHTQPYAAIVVYVTSDTQVNLVVFGPVGIPHQEHDVFLKQNPEDNPIGSYCEWMPYQIGQAKKDSTQV